MRGLSQPRSYLLTVLLVYFCGHAAAQPAPCLDYDTASPHYVRTIATDGSDEEMQIVGNLAYAAAGADGFLVWDVTDPERPALLSSLHTGTNLSSVWVSGNYAYVGEWWPGILVIDISDPLAPTVVGSVATPGHAADVSGAGDLLCVADGYGLATVDIAVPGDPRLLGYAGPVPTCTDVAVVGDVAYLATYLGIESYDVSDPASPTLLTRLEGLGQVLSIKVRDGLAYLPALADSWDINCGVCPRFSIVDVSDPTDLALVGLTYFEETARDLVIEGRYAYLPSLSHGLVMIDIADPTEPVVIGYGRFSGPRHGFTGIVIKDQTAIVSGGDAGLEIYDLRGPVLTDVLRIPGTTLDFVVRDGVAYVGAGYNDPTNWELRTGLQTVDVSNPADLRLLGSLSFSEVTHFAAMAWPYVYMRDGVSKSLFVVDVSDPAVPVEVNHLVLPAVARGVAVQGEFMVVGTDSTVVLVYDISQGWDPVLAASVATPYPARGINLAEDRIYVSSFQNGLMVLDWSDPRQPSVAGILAIPDLTGTAAVHQALIYANRGFGKPLEVVDATDPAGMRVVGQLDDGGFGGDLGLMAIRGDLGYLGSRDGGVLTVDLSDPRAPRVFGQLLIPDVYRIDPTDDGLFVLSWSRDLYIGTLSAVPLACGSISAVRLPAPPVSALNLGQNRPNPFNPRTEIAFSVSGEQPVTLAVYDLQGRLVRTLLDGEVLPAREHTVIWDGTNRAGRPVGAGVYLYRLTAGPQVETRRMILIK